MYRKECTHIFLVTDSAERLSGCEDEVEQCMQSYLTCASTWEAFASSNNNSAVGWRKEASYKDINIYLDLRLKVCLGSRMTEFV